MCPIFSSNFNLFTKLYPLKNYEKCLFDLKSSFCSRYIQFFVFLPFPLFLPVGHCFRGWSKTNVKVHDIINCLNKNSVTHFVWYLGKEKSYDNETLSLEGVSAKEHFYSKIMQKMGSKNQSQPLHARNYFKSKIFWRRIIKKLTSFFHSNPVPFNRQSHQK